MSNKRLIDANALLKDMKIHLAMLNRAEFASQADGFAQAMDHVEKAQTLYVQVSEAASWNEDVAEDRAPNTHFYCSHCKFMTGQSAYFMRYCPNCGAKMSGLQKSIL